MQCGWGSDTSIIIHLIVNDFLERLMSSFTWMTCKIILKILLILVSKCEITGMLLLLKMYCGAVLCGLWFASAPSTVCVSVYCGIVFCELGTLFGVPLTRQKSYKISSNLTNYLVYFNQIRRQKSHENLRAKSHECRGCFLAVHNEHNGRALPTYWRCTRNGIGGAPPGNPTCTTGKDKIHEDFSVIIK